MENSELNKVTDVRQSPGWVEYLKFLGWKVFKTKSGVNIVILNSFLGSVAKIQRPQNLSPQDLKEIDEICLREHSMFAKIEPALNQNLSIFEPAGYFSSFHPLLPPSTIFIDLTKSEMALWEQLSKNARYSVQRAQREGSKVEVHQNPRENILKEFQTVMIHTAKTKKILIPSLAELKKKVEAFGDHSFIGLARNGRGDIMAGNFYVGFGDCVWYLNGGTSIEGRKNRWGGHELLWQSFLYFKKKGYKWFDLEGRDDPRFPTFTKRWGGFSHFKEKFGGTSVQFPYPQLKLYSPILKILKTIYGKIPL